MKKLQQNITKNMMVKRPPISKPVNIKKADINDCEEIKMTNEELDKKTKEYFHGENFKKIPFKAKSSNDMDK